MGTLHLVACQGPELDAFEACAKRLKAGDSLVLIANGGFAQLRKAEFAAILNMTSACTVYVLALEDEGLEPGRPFDLPVFVRLVDMRGFVALTEAHNPIVTWG